MAPSTRSVANVSGSLVSKESAIALFAIVGIAAHLLLRYAVEVPAPLRLTPLYAVLIAGGVPLVLGLLVKLLRREFGSDLLAGMSIVTAVLLHEYLAGALVVLMLSGGETLERFAVRSASSVLRALAKRMPNVAHRKIGGALRDITLDEVVIGDLLVVLPHEACPADGTVVEGHGVMDEAYLTGEPYVISKGPGSAVLSGAVNGESALTIQAAKRPVDSRYASIVSVMRKAEEDRPRIRRLADQLGALYTPVAVSIALTAWLASGDSLRFLAVLVVATPCPLLIAIPVAIIGAISLAAKRGIIVRDPAVLEQADRCSTVIFDKTGTLTYGEPALIEQIVAPGFDNLEVLRLVAGLERYSKHPLAKAILVCAEAAGLTLPPAAEVSEPPGQGLVGVIEGHRVQVTKRSKFIAEHPSEESSLPPPVSGLECVIVIGGKFAATYRFRDAPRSDSRPFIEHLSAKHGFKKVMLVSGDRESEVKYLGDTVGITDVRASMSPEEKVAIVRKEMETAQTLFVGDGINDAPALASATVGIAFGQNSDVSSEAAGAVVLTASLGKVDEFFHISRRMRTIALQSAWGGMALSAIGMILAGFGYLPPVAGAVTQEIIDVAVILNALRAAVRPKSLVDY
jgi:heavy metal translocating P-type ATPase